MYDKRDRITSDYHTTRAKIPKQKKRLLKEFIESGGRVVCLNIYVIANACGTVCSNASVENTSPVLECHAVIAQYYTSELLVT